MLPSDIVGTRVFDQRTGDFATALGPIFANVLLADEINRAPAKVQSALLEGMQERQVTIGPATHPLPDPFLVTATMNPLDSDGTYPLPFAQMDRFLMKILVAYPSAEEELAILERFGGAPPAMLSDIATPADLLRWRDEASISIAAQARARRSRSWRRRAHARSATGVPSWFPTTFGRAPRPCSAIASRSTIARSRRTSILRASSPN